MTSPISIHFLDGWSLDRRPRLRLRPKLTKHLKDYDKVNPRAIRPATLPRTTALMTDAMADAMADAAARLVSSQSDECHCCSSLSYCAYAMAGVQQPRPGTIARQRVSATPRHGPIPASACMRNCPARPEHCRPSLAGIASNYVEIQTPYRRRPTSATATERVCHITEPLYLGQSPARFNVFSIKLLSLVLFSSNVARQSALTNDRGSPGRSLFPIPRSRPPKRKTINPNLAKILPPLSTTPPNMSGGNSRSGAHDQEAAMIGTLHTSRDEAITRHSEVSSPLAFPTQPLTRV